MFATAQARDFEPVTDDMLRRPEPEDWLMLGRTCDQQRYSPLQEIDTENVQQRRMVWSRGLPSGTQSTIPIVHAGVMYVVWPINAVLGGVIQMSTISCVVGGRQDIAVMTGAGNSATRNPARMAGITSPLGHNAIYTFALP